MKKFANIGLESLAHILGVLLVGRKSKLVWSATATHYLSAQQERQRKKSRVYTTSNHVGGEIMREEYDIMNLNPGKNPYAKTGKKQVTINLDEKVIAYFKNQSEEIGIPYQTLINLYLCDCMKNNRQPEIVWKQSVS